MDRGLRHHAYPHKLLSGSGIRTLISSFTSLNLSVHICGMEIKVLTTQDCYKDPPPPPMTSFKQSGGRRGAEGASASTLLQPGPSASLCWITEALHHQCPPLSARPVWKSRDKFICPPYSSLAHLPKCFPCKASPGFELAVCSGSVSVYL